MNLINIKDYKDDSWRNEFNGTEFLVECDLCGVCEDETKELYKIELNQNNDYLICDKCIITLKTTLEAV